MTELEHTRNSSGLSFTFNDIPTMLWSGLLHGLLENLLEFRVVDGGVMALQWKNRSLKEFAVEKYFADEARRVHTSGALADYFSGNLQSIETLHNNATSKQSCTTVKLMHVTITSLLLYHAL